MNNHVVYVGSKIRLLLIDQVAESVLATKIGTSSCERPVCPNFRIYANSVHVRRWIHTTSLKNTTDIIMILHGDCDTVVDKS